jgi:hypothetical protein
MIIASPKTFSPLLTLLRLKELLMPAKKMNMIAEILPIKKLMPLS